MKKIEIVASKQDRVLKVLERECANVVYSAFASALRKKDVLVNGARIKENVIVPSGSHITIFVSDDAIKKDMFEIVYEDDNVLFVNNDILVPFF